MGCTDQVAIQQSASRQPSPVGGRHKDKAKSKEEHVYIKPHNYLPFFFFFYILLS